MAGGNTLSFRPFQVCINRAQVIGKLSGMGVTNGPYFFDDFVIQHFLLQEVLPVYK
jgi:hypothetical protein